MSKCDCCGAYHPKECTCEFEVWWGSDEENGAVTICLTHDRELQ